MPQEMRQEAALMRAIKDDYKRVTIASYDYKGYKLPTQIDIPELSEDVVKEGYQYVVYSQTHQNESDKLSHLMSVDYAEDRYDITQDGKEFTFNGTYGVGGNRATSNG